MKIRRMAIGLVAALVMACVYARPARAYDAPTTQAGLVQKAAVRAQLHRWLVEAMDRPLGLLEPIRLDPHFLSVSRLADLMPRLETLDPAEGYRPDANGVTSAIGWLAAGAVIAEVPPERGRHHFLDPTTGRGLDDGHNLSGATHSLRLAMDGAAGLRQMATGTAFNLTGKSVLAWIESPQNDLSLPAALDALVDAAGAPSIGARDAALVQALLALGGVAAALVDMGNPAHVRNDFRGSHGNLSQIGLWDKRSAFDAFVADRFGRQGVPEPAVPVRRPHLYAFFTAPDGQGLADKTQRQFFSDGTVPGDVLVTPATTPRAVVDDARATLVYPAPDVPGLDLTKGGVKRYVENDGRRVLAYTRTPDRVRFFLNESVYEATAHAVLPEIGAYLVGLLDHLVRARLQLSAHDEALDVTVAGLTGALQEGKLTVYSEDEEGQRTPLGPPQPITDATQSVRAAVAIPAGASKVVVAVRGQDQAGPFVAQGALVLR